MTYAIAFLIGYLCGCPNAAHFIAHLKKVDIRNNGSGNPGTSNAVILLGWKAGAIVAVCDIGKAVAAVLIARALFPSLAFAGAVAGVACVLGHMFPFYLCFKGGKGFASYLGMALAMNWKFALILMVAVVLITLITDYIVVGTMTTIVALPVFYLLTSSLTIAIILCAASLPIVIKHRTNLVRIYNGTEIGFRSVKDGQKRMDK